jgi:predicted acylesterase/phospholipase RssA
MLRCDGQSEQGLDQRRGGKMTAPCRLVVAFCLCGLGIPGRCQNPEQTSAADAAGPSIGIVLTGGGSFGAFEVGALKAYFDHWRGEHGGAPPPIVVVSGTSTGALIGPFAALGPSAVDEVAQLYQNVGPGDILRIKASVFLPLFLFSKLSSSVFSARPLENLLAKRLSDDRLSEIAQMWPHKRLVVVATNFGDGQPATFTNAPDDIRTNLTRFREGALASTISPLATPPVYIKPDSARNVQPYLDGGIHAVAPFQALFDLVTHSPNLHLTHIVVFSAFPLFPSTDLGQAQTHVFPAHPQFGDIGARMDALISESSVTKEVHLVCAAIELRKREVSVERVRELTGLSIPTVPKELILIAPSGRLGWDNLKFDKNEMKEMFERGQKAMPLVLVH